MPKTPRSKNPEETIDSAALDDVLKIFLDSFEQLAIQITNGMLELITDEDEKLVAEAFSAPLTEQVRELCSYVRDKSAGLSAQGRLEVANVVRLSAGPSLVASGSALASNLASTSARVATSGLFSLIKKIIRALLDIFNIQLPDWLWRLLDLIDELLNQFLSIGSPQLAHALSLKHQDYLAEMVQVERLQRETSWLFRAEESDV